jgi:hypothetical protein
VENIVKEGFTFVSSLLQLSVVRSRLNEVEELLGESLVGDGPGWMEKDCQ